MIFGAETVNLQTRDRIRMTPHDDANISTCRSGAHAVSNGVRHMRRIVRHEIHAVAAAATLTNSAKLSEGVSD